MQTKTSIINESSVKDELLNIELSEKSLSNNPRHVHFIGIGGISMSGLAEILISQGFIISGSDIKTSDITKKLADKGATIYIGHDENNIKGADIVVYTAAIKESNPELLKAKELGLLAVDRATLLGNIMKAYPWSIAVSGTHGKTTTSSMISTIMLESKKDPTIHIGGELNCIGGTTRIGHNGFFIAEACEYYESFLKLNPFMAIILNVEYDHADFFKDIQHVRETFHNFSKRVPGNGYLLYPADDQYISDILKEVSCNKITFGLDEKKADWAARNIVFGDSGCASYELIEKGNMIANIALAAPGMHNVLNSLAAIAACRVFGCSTDSIAAALAGFTGTHRRFEEKGIINGIKVIDDYAHHPSEVKATLKAAARIKQNKTWCVFQPHTYTRTRQLMKDFALSFKDADTVLITDIYAAREPDPGDIHSSMLADEINSRGGKAIYLKSFEEAVQYLKNNTKSGDLVITMGAGDIYKVGEMFLEG